MDSKLWELLEEGAPGDEVAAIVRLRQPGLVPPQVRLVSRFGEIATCRLKREDILAVRNDPNVASLKAPRLYGADPELAEPAEPVAADLEAVIVSDARRPEAEEATGKGVVIGVVDWGCDFAHSDFRHPDGSTRLLALWDQRSVAQPVSPDTPNLYGYGTIHSAVAINRALVSRAPYAALNYHPGMADPDGSGSHGTHVLSIAAGNGQAGGPLGVAPEADLVFVHLSTPTGHEFARLGDSVALLEAVDFISQVAGEHPCVINLSMGRHAGAHDGTSLVEQAFDQFLSAVPGRCIVQSVGNYFTRPIHVAGELRPGETRVIHWETDEADVTPNELDLWYPRRDRFIVELVSPDGAISARVGPGEQTALELDGKKVGKMYNRTHDPNNSDNQAEIFLYPDSPGGLWQVRLIGEDVMDGRFHTWIERDANCSRCQSQFDPRDAVPFTTTGTICNGYRTIAVGAYDPHSPDGRLAPFSSSGPTRDGRQKPDLVAPGVRILAARSASRDELPPSQGLIRKSGTSMAAPHVTGTVALMFEVAQAMLPIQHTRNLLLQSAVDRSPPEHPEDAARLGNGYLDVEGAVEATRQWVRGKPGRAARDLSAPPPPEPSTPDSTMSDISQSVRPINETAPDVQVGEALPKTAAADSIEIQLKEGSLIGQGESKEHVSDSSVLATAHCHTCSEAQADTAEAKRLTENSPWTSENLEQTERKIELVEALPPNGPIIPENPGARIVQFVDAGVANGAIARDASALLQSLLARTEATSLRGSSGLRLSFAPAVIFDAFAAGGSPLARQYLDSFFDIVAAPGSFLTTNLDPGDLLLRRGEGGLGHSCVVATPEFRVQQQSPGFVFESKRPGRYVHVVESGAQPHRLADAFARRITDSTGRLPLDTLVLRLRPPVPLAQSAETIGPASMPNRNGSAGAEACSPFLTGNHGGDYYDDVQPQTLGVVTPLINGRSSGGIGPDVDRTEPLDEMQAAVSRLGSGDFVYLAAWFFEPATQLTGGSFGGATNWGRFLAAKANAGVRVRLILNDFDPILEDFGKWLQRSCLWPLNAIISALPAHTRDNYKYILSMHPAHFGALKSLLAGQGVRNINIASHHQKFMIVRHGEEMLAFCGGLDIESRKTPSRWNYSGLIGWHDLHVKLEGPITRDLEKEFVLRWNREKAHSTRPLLAGWAPHESLTQTPLSGVDNGPGKRMHRVQMLRTISSDAVLTPFSNERDDVIRAYRRVIECARDFIYMENQYYRSPHLADHIVRQGRAHSNLIVIMVVLAVAAADDGTNLITEHGDHLQFDTFQRITRGLGERRVRLYTMHNRSVHSKFLLADDTMMIVGSANANERSFQLDSELNVVVNEPALVSDFRRRLWAHNLGVVATTVAGWTTADFITQWDAVAGANVSQSAPDMAGEGVIPFDFTAVPGRPHGSLPDVLANIDFSRESGIFAGHIPPGRNAIALRPNRRPSPPLVV